MKSISESGKSDEQGRFMELKAALSGERFENLLVMAVFGAGLVKELANRELNQRGGAFRANMDDIPCEYLTNMNVIC